MKRLLFIALALPLWLCSMANERPIEFASLPANAQQFIATHFAGEKVSYSTVESGLTSNSYEVRLDDGTKVEFNGSGDWKEVERRGTAIPAAIVPKPIADYVKAHYPSAHITKIERNRRSTDVDLSNGLEITFDANYAVVKVDD